MEHWLTNVIVSIFLFWWEFYFLLQIKENFKVKILNLVFLYLDLGKGAGDFFCVNTQLRNKLYSELWTLCLRLHMFCYVKSYVIQFKIRKQTAFLVSCVLSYVIVILNCNHRKLDFTDVKMYMIAPQCVCEVYLKLTLSSSLFFPFLTTCLGQHG